VPEKPVNGLTGSFGKYVDGYEPLKSVKEILKDEIVKRISDEGLN